MNRILAWNCSDGDLPHADDEAMFLESLRGDDCEVTIATSTLEWEDLAAYARRVRPTIFHFIGHGDSKGQLSIREGGIQVARPAVDVVRLVRAASAGLEGVYLSGCFTAKSGPELLDPIPTSAGWAIGTAAEIDDELAAQFSRKFYGHLIKEDASAEEAYAVANAYIASDWGDEALPGAWLSLSRLPDVPHMAQTIFTALRGVFNRAAFRVEMRQEASMHELDDALNDVSHALGTGQVRSRQHRTVIAPASFPASWLDDADVANFVAEVTRGIADARQALAVVRAGAGGMEYVVGNALNLDSNVAQDKWLVRINEVDRTRNRIIRAANVLFVDSGLEPLPEIRVSFSAKEIREAKSRDAAARLP